MATAYTIGASDDWTEVVGSGGTGVLSAEQNTCLVHFGPTKPVSYIAGYHHHLEPNDVPFYYGGSQKAWVWAGGNTEGTMNVTQTCKLVFTGFE